MEVTLLDSFLRTRELTLKIISYFSHEEMNQQPAEWVSPTKWHLGHTTWFFDQMVLTKAISGYEVSQKTNHAFNSYYESFGKRVARGERSLISDFTFDEVLEYRQSTEGKVKEALSSGVSKDLEDLVLLGIHHEKQHQELMLQDLKSVRSTQQEATKIPTDYSFQNHERKPLQVAEGLAEIGATHGFAYDNEYPRHRLYLYEAKISKSLVTNGDYLEFMDSGGYNNFSHWLSDGFSWVHKNKVDAPLYWRKNHQNKWEEFCLWQGWHALNLLRPVSHVSYYEASAFAKWKKARLPLEAELELFEEQSFQTVSSNHEMPVFSNETSGCGPLWQWTSSDFASYPRYKPANDATMEYNSKFMCSQKILRGGSYATPPDHYRPSYRNFYYPHERWMYSGVRLAYDN